MAKVSASKAQRYSVWVGKRNAPLKTLGQIGDLLKANDFDVEVHSPNWDGGGYIVSWQNFCFCFFFFLCCWSFVFMFNLLISVCSKSTMTWSWPGPCGTTSTTMASTWVLRLAQRWRPMAPLRWLRSLAMIAWHQSVLHLKDLWHLRGLVLAKSLAHF